MKNRIVRFRCWDMKTKQWKQPARNIYFGFEVDEPGSRWVFTEFSNYKTPAGTDIFEGDLVEYYSTGYQRLLTGVCFKKEDGGFAVKFYLNQVTNWITTVDKVSKDCQVIGNIFTGPQIKGLT
jgi:hypothetical protein